MLSRREFLSQVTFASSARGIAFDRNSVSSNNEPTRAAAGRRKVLILGGTGFIGPHFVRSAVEGGHAVTVFNRGRANGDLPGDVERLIGDRNSDLRALMRRDWDVVIDLAVRRPLWVRTIGEALRGHVGHYTFISSGAVYKHTLDSLVRTDESSETLTFDLPVDPYLNDAAAMSAVAVKTRCIEGDTPEACFAKANTYGVLKAQCELEVDRQFAGIALVVRPCYIVGPGDPSVFLPYWLARIERGGEILGPGDPLHPVHFIDARDLADWVIHMTERGEIGTYNATGPAYSMSMCELLGAIRSLFSVPARMTWVKSTWAMDRDVVNAGVSEWSVWNFSNDDSDMAYNSDKALAKGLTYRPLHTTLVDSLAWYHSLPADARKALATGIRVDSLVPLRSRRVMTSWDDLLREEGEILARYHAHRSSY